MKWKRLHFVHVQSLLAIFITHTHHVDRRLRRLPLVRRWCCFCDIFNFPNEISLEIMLNIWSKNSKDFSTRQFSMPKIYVQFSTNFTIKHNYFINLIDFSFFFFQFHFFFTRFFLFFRFRFFSSFTLYVEWRKKKKKFLIFCVVDVVAVVASTKYLSHNTMDNER